MTSPSDARAKAEAYRNGLAMLSRSERRRMPPASLAEDLNSLLAMTKGLLPNVDPKVFPPRVQTTWVNGVETSVADYAALRVYSLQVANLLARHFPDSLRQQPSAPPSQVPNDDYRDLFPWEDVDAARSDESLQAAHAFEVENYAGRHLNEVFCPRCSACLDLSWFYFRTREETWLCSQGKGGWMVVCDECRIQVAFFCDEYG